MEVFNLATKEKQEEILSFFPISGGTDISSYRAYSFAAKQRYLNLTKVLEINGKGFIDVLTIKAVPNFNLSDCVAIIEVTLDDEKIVDIYINNTSTHSGVNIRFGYSYKPSSSTFVKFPSLPIVSNSSSDIGFVGSIETRSLPLYFNRNLTVRVKSPYDPAEINLSGGIGI